MFLNFGAFLMFFSGGGGASKKHSPLLLFFLFLNKTQKSGNCFHEVRLSEAIDVQNIRVEPDGAAHFFVVRI